jgi:hypothetical protein
MVNAPLPPKFLCPFFPSIVPCHPPNWGESPPPPFPPANSQETIPEAKGESDWPPKIYGQQAATFYIKKPDILVNKEAKMKEGEK